MERIEIRCWHCKGKGTTTHWELTKEEKNIIKELRNKLSNRAIARKLKIHHEYVNRYVGKVLDK